jgi:putative ABC transport system ATP-binding protein
MSSDPIIRLEHISKSFLVGSEIVYGLRNASIQVDKGEYIAIMGPSGSGKSTLLNILGLLDQPNEGSYFLEGNDVTSLTDDERAHIRRERIGFVFQFFHLVPRLTAQENIELPMVLAGITPAARRRRVKDILDQIGLAERASHRPEQLSGGQRQRIAIARATIMQPTVMLADEPTGNLDRAAGHDVVKILEALNQKGLTLIMVTHDPELGHRARRQIRMDDGNIFETGS